MDDNDKKYAVMMAGFILGRYSSCDLPESLEDVRTEMNGIGIPSKKGETYVDLVKLMTKYLEQQDTDTVNTVAPDNDDDAWNRAMKVL